MSEHAGADKRELVIGTFTALGLSVLCGFVAPLLLVGMGGAFLDVLGILAVVPACIGVTQLFWIVPYASKLKREARTMRLKGVYLAAAITFLLNGACWGVLGLSLGSTSFH